jgi:hypothetical protein
MGRGEDGRDAGTVCSVQRRTLDYSLYLATGGFGSGRVAQSLTISTCAMCDAPHLQLALGYTRVKRPALIDITGLHLCLPGSEGELGE